jgi:hypothetical protein
MPVLPVNKRISAIRVVFSVGKPTASVVSWCANLCSTLNGRHRLDCRVDNVTHWLDPLSEHRLAVRSKQQRRHSWVELFLYSASLTTDELRASFAIYLSE